jgi:hypothetical protein
MHAHKANGRGTALGILTVGAVVIGSLGVAKAADQRVDWTNQVNVAARGNILEKVAGCQGCDDAGAVSRQRIDGGNGYVEFTIGEANSFVVAGLSHADGSTHFDRIDFGVRFNGSGGADVLENGTYEAGSDIRYTPGDMFRVAVVNGRVEYSKNGSVFYRSNRSPRYPLAFETALGTVGATVRNARIEPDMRVLADNDRGYYRDESQRLSTYDRNRDGVVSRAEWRGSRRDFNQIDVNRDGLISRRELARADNVGGAVGTSGRVVTVNSNEMWTDTGIWVQAGDMITVDADGTVRLSANANDLANPDGAPSGRRAVNSPMRARPVGSLIARVGDSPAVAMGAHRTTRARESGELYLGINDDFFRDNSGQYRVTVTVER